MPADWCWRFMTAGRWTIFRHAAEVPVDQRGMPPPVTLSEECATMPLSARNHLAGTIDGIQWSDVVVHVTVKVGDELLGVGDRPKSADEMRLKQGRCL